MQPQSTVQQSSTNGNNGERGLGKVFQQAQQQFQQVSHQFSSYPQQPMPMQYQQAMPGQYPVQQQHFQQPHSQQPQYPPQQQQFPVQPGNSAVVISQQYCVPAPVQLIVQEQFSLSGDDFTACDQSGRMWFKIDARAFSFSDRRTLLDCQGTPVASIAKKLMSIHGSWCIYSGANKGSLICTVKPPIVALKPKVSVYMAGREDQPAYIARGNFLAKKFQICKVEAGGQEVPIAEVAKESSFASMQSYFKASHGMQRYFLTIQPNVDTAFIVALCVTIDEAFHDEKS